MSNLPPSWRRCSNSIWTSLVEETRIREFSRGRLRAYRAVKGVLFVRKQREALITVVVVVAAAVETVRQVDYG